MANIKVCPKTEQDIKTASNKLKCKYDRYNNSQYMCIPNKEKTSLVEFCHDGEMGIVEEGNCLEASVGTVSLHNCSGFERGCPNTTFFKYEIHKHSVCQEINTDQNCYVADPFCLPQKGDDVFNTYNVVIIVFAIIGFGLICYFRKKIISAICRCTRGRKPIEQDEGVSLVGYINLEEKNSTQPKTLARIELNESVNQGQTDNKAGPPADHINAQASNVQPQSECIEKDITKKDGSPGHKDEHFAQPKMLVKIEYDKSVNQGRTENKAGPSAGHIKDQASNFQPQSEYIEKEITKKDGSPSQKGLYIDIKDDANIGAIHSENCDRIHVTMGGKSAIREINITNNIDRENSGPSSDRTENPESAGRSSNRTEDRENSGPSSERTEDLESFVCSSDRTEDRENSGPSSDQTENPESSGRSSDRTDDRENTGPTYDRNEDQESFVCSSDRTEDRENSGPSSDRTENRENSGPSSDRAEDRENSGPTYERNEDRKNSGPSSDQTENRESPGRLFDRTDDPEISSRSSDRTKDLQTMLKELDYYGSKREPSNTAEGAEPYLSFKALAKGSGNKATSAGTHTEEETHVKDKAHIDTENRMEPIGQESEDDIEENNTAT